MKILTFLPVFSGFYNTIFEADLSLFECSEDKTINDYTFDYKGYENLVAKRCCIEIADFLNKTLNTNLKCEFQEICSPKYYNFSNDSINVAFIVKKKDLSTIVKYLKDNKAAFNDYIVQKYTSCSGFTSYYSNNVETWLLDYMKDIETNQHYLGSILGFICENEDFKEIDLYNAIEIPLIDYEILN